MKRPTRLLPGMHSRRKPAARPAGRQATIRSIARRRRYRRSDRPSCVRSSGRRLLRCGVISSMPRAANARSSASLSQALSPTTRSGTSFVRMKSNNPCTKVDSCGRAGQLCTAMGHPRASTAIKIFTPLAHLRASDPVASTTCRRERRIQKAFAQPILSLLLQQLPRLLQQPFEDALPHQPLEEPVHGALRAELSRPILSFGSALQQPEDPRQCLALVGPGTAALGVLGKIRNARAEAIQQYICKFQHSGKTTDSRTPVNGFGDRFQVARGSAVA